MAHDGLLTRGIKVTDDFTFTFSANIDLHVCTYFREAKATVARSENRGTKFKFFLRSISLYRSLYTLKNFLGWNVQNPLTIALSVVIQCE